MSLRWRDSTHQRSYDVDVDTLTCTSVRKSLTETTVGLISEPGEPSCGGTRSVRVYLAAATAGAVSDQVGETSRTPRVLAGWRHPHQPAKGRHGEDGWLPALTLDRTPRFSVDGMSGTTLRRTGLRVAELAAAVGVSSDTVRYYERVGLLPAPARTAAGYRAYDGSAVDRLRFIQGAQRLGLKLSDIRDLLAIRDTGICPCEPAEQVLRRRLADLDAEMARLSSLRAEMVSMIEAMPADGCPPPAPGTWCPPTTKGGDPDA
jgi:DNA-binding transcriptional MerR regulator